MLLDADDSHLVLVDYQERLMPAIAGGTEVVAQAVRLARAARLLEVPLAATEQNPDKLGATVPELRDLVQGARGRVLSKMAFSAAGEGLAALLRPPARAQQPAGNARSLPRHLQQKQAAETAAPARSTIVLAGCEAHVCLLQTALELLDDEFDVCVVTDACGSRADRNRDAAFDRLAGAGVELVTTEMVLFEWLRSAEHPAFREVHALIK